MSNLVFPIMPIILPEQEPTPEFSTDESTSPSGKRVSISYRASPIEKIVFSLYLRTWVNAPAGAWGTISEAAMFRYFFVTHRGRWDSFLLDNSTGAYCEFAGSQPRVVFTTDRLPWKKLRPGLYLAKCQLKSVL